MPLPGHPLQREGLGAARSCLNKSLDNIRFRVLVGSEKGLRLIIVRFRVWGSADA